MVRYHLVALLAVAMMGIQLSSRTGWTQQTDQPAEPNEQQRLEQFRKTLSGSVLEGLFTVDGQDLTDVKPDRYEIHRVTKMPQGDYWMFHTRIKYGDHDVTVPLPLRVVWAGSTPVITLDQVAIPGLGTFDARVMIHQDRYVGTWQHGEKGGHLFGRVVKEESDESEESDGSDRSN